MNNFKIFLQSILLLFCYNPTAPLKILVYSPAFAASHTNYMARLADTLTEAGHNVTFFVPIIDESRENHLGVKLTKDVIKLEVRQHVLVKHELLYFSFES